MGLRPWCLRKAGAGQKKCTRVKLKRYFNGSCQIPHQTVPLVITIKKSGKNKTKQNKTKQNSLARFIRTHINIFFGLSREDVLLWFVSVAPEHERRL